MARYPTSCERRWKMSLPCTTAWPTGWFRHANTDQRVLAATADLAARGTQVSELYECLFQRESPARVRLFGAALESLELFCNNRLSLMTLVVIHLKAQ